MEADEANQDKPEKENPKNDLNALHISQQVSDTIFTEKYPCPPEIDIWPAMENTLACKGYIEIKFL